MKTLIAYFSAGGVTKNRVETGERLKAGISAADLKKWASKWE